MIITLAMAALGQSQNQPSAKKVMEGSWRVTVTPGPAPIPLPPSVEAIVTYIPGGGLIESDNLAVQGSLASAGKGAWKATAPREFSITFTKFIFSTQGLFQGSVRITESINRDSSDTEYTGEGNMVILDPTGNPILIIPVTSRATYSRHKQSHTDQRRGAIANETLDEKSRLEDTVLRVRRLFSIRL